MLQITVTLAEGWDEQKEEFVDLESVTLDLEHSLASISKWEQRWHKAFFSKEAKTAEETIDYIKCMTLTPNVNPEVYNHISNNNMNEIDKYIEDPMTATKFFEDKQDKTSKKVITAERIYCWMFLQQIPLEFENRHINHLLALLRVFNAENGTSKKMSPKETIAHNKAINAKNRALLQSKGRS